MARPPKLHVAGAVDRAFDEARFGAGRTLNLRTLQPSPAQAVAHVEQWLRLQQVQGVREVLVITGRGNQSAEGWSPVREAVSRLFPSLRRRNVIAASTEHTAGSFLVTLAPMRALFEAPKRRREPRADRSRALKAPASLSALEAETIALLRELAQLTLRALGVHAPSEDTVRDEMQRQFAALAAVVPDNADREAMLQQAVQRAVEEFEG